MKTTKKFLSLVFVAILVFLLGIPAYGAEFNSRPTILNDFELIFDNYAQKTEDRHYYSINIFERQIESNQYGCASYVINPDSDSEDFTINKSTVKVYGDAIRSVVETAISKVNASGDVQLSVSITVSVDKDGVIKKVFDYDSLKITVDSKKYNIKAGWDDKLTYVSDNMTFFEKLAARIRIFFRNLFPGSRNAMA